jgi:hypothetical protein
MNATSQRKSIILSNGRAKTSFYSVYPNLPISDSIISFLRYNKAESVKLPLWAKQMHVILQDDPKIILAYSAKRQECFECKDLTNYFVSGTCQSTIKAVSSMTGGNPWVFLCCFECLEKIQNTIANEAIFLGVVDETE